jgi:hypothetical protein
MLFGSRFSKSFHFSAFLFPEGLPVCQVDSKKPPDRDVNVTYATKRLYIFQAFEFPGDTTCAGIGELQIMLQNSLLGTLSGFQSQLLN